MKEVLLYGASPFAATVGRLAEDCGFTVAGRIDDFKPGPHVLGGLAEVVVSHPPSRYAVAMAIGYNDLVGRRAACERLKAAGYDICTLTHPRAYVAKDAVIEAGALLMAGSLVDTRATVGEFTVIWPGVCVNHDSIIGANSFLSPGSIICGNVRVGHSTFIGAGANILDGAEVPANSYVKAGTLYFTPRGAGRP